jgi:aryl-alcohol dehydrogenase-like predicted oxidoreductase
MKYKILGKTGVSVSNLCMGTMSFGEPADKNESAAMYRSCREAGVNFFDCANVYNNGEAEKILGELIREERDEVIITSKYTFRTSPGVNGIGSSRLNAVREVEKSLARLKTDRIDLYFVHSFDPCTSIEETIRALDDLVRAGKILYIGASNWAAWQIMKALGTAERHGWSSITCIQPMFNLVKRQAEVELFPMAQSENLGVITFSPLAGGLLARRQRHEGKPHTGRFAEMPRYQDRYRGKEIHDASEAFISLAESRGIKPATLGVAWVMSHPAVTAPIIGARNHNQLQDSLAAAEFSPDPETLALAGSLFAAPPPATDRSDDALEGYGLRG